MIDMDVLVRLHICKRLGDVDTWVAMGPERQQVRAMAGTAQINLEGPERLQRLEEEFHGLRESFREQRLVVEAMSRDFLRFTTWGVGRLGQLLDVSGKVNTAAEVMKKLFKVVNAARVKSLYSRILMTVVATLSTEAEYVAVVLKFNGFKISCWTIEFASPKQTALGEDYLNPFMAGSLPKTKWHFITAVSYKLILFGLTIVAAVNLTLLGFDQIMDFLNAHAIQYALVVNPTIYISCIKQFWASTTIKKVNVMVQLYALIDGKKVVITEDAIRQDLHLYDADGVWKFLIHTLVQCVSIMRTAWNEFSCSMASSVICLATCRKFNFSKYIFDSMAAEEREEVKVPNAPTPPSTTSAPSPLLQDPTPTPHATPPASPPQEQPTTTSESSMSLLNILMETRATLSNKVAELEQDKHTQALEILKLKKRAIDADEDITLVDVETQVDMDDELQGRINQDVSAATKDVSAAEPNVFDNEDVTMTMAQTLIKMKAEKAKLLDEQIAKMLHDEEVKKAAARDKQEKDDLERAQVLQKQYDDKEENIDWNAVAEKIKEKHLENIRKYQSLKRKPVSIAQARKNMIIYLKNMAGYKMEHFRGMNYDKVMYPIIDWEIQSEGSRTYWKIIRVVKEKFSSAVPNVDKEKALWVKLKRLFKPDADDVLWKLQRYMHYPITWKLYTNCGVHQVSSTTRRHDMFMLTEKYCPLSNGVMTLMLNAKLQVEEDSEMARDLVMKIFIEANKPKSKSLDTSFK
nr:hypothetical protein [Tanacetum cinerariifolium]